MLRDLHHITRTCNVGSPGVCAGVYAVFAVYVPTWLHRKSPWSSISLLCRCLPAILLFQAGDQATSVLATESCLNDIDAWMLTNMLKLNKEKNGTPSGYLGAEIKHQCSESKMQRFGKITDFISQKYNTVIEATQ